MKINDVLHGFVVERVRTSEELKGTLYEMRHLKSGALLAWLDNNEDNKLFSVAFKTLPWDDTGVFHILEHSVLAGSEGYPVKEPFLDLLKSSMNTFLNAMTFPDKTMYPVSSRNEQDFINLMRVYLDAVFRPLIYKNESIFRQEGWHFELDGEKPSFNGVVFNEMKGALASVDGKIEDELMKALYPNSVYGFESGGDPKAIPTLTYENFLRAHREFYAPSNARIYLDGAVELEKVLKIIDEEYLSNFDYIEQNHDIVMQPPVDSKELSAFYEIGKEEDESDKAQLVFGKVFASWEERKRIMAYSLISSYLAGSNEAPLKRAILEKELAQNVEFSVLDGIAQPLYSIHFRNIKAENKEKIKEVYDSVLNKILENGIDKEELTACLNQFEFSLREAEEPKGLTRNIYALNSWLYGGDMLMYLENNAVLRELREAIDTDYYKDIIAEFLDSKGRISLVMLPSKTMGDEEKAAEELRAKEQYSALSEEEKAESKRVYERMREWQDAPDTPEASATLPVLSVSDVSKEPRWLDTEFEQKNNTRFLYHELSANGIVHVKLYFSVSDEEVENIPKLSLLTDLLGVLPTEKYSASELQKEIKKTIGSLDFNLHPLRVSNKADECRPYFEVAFSVLEENLESAVHLVCEILLNTDYTRSDMIKENLLQCSEELYQGVMSAGHRFAISRALTSTSALAVYQEMSDGFELYKFLEKLVKNYDENAAELAEYLKMRSGEIFTSARLTVSETSDKKHSSLSRIQTLLPEGKAVLETAKIPLKNEPVKEAILIPSGVSYAAYGSNLLPCGFAYEGKLTVTALLLTYGYLWNEIRVHGGAYGCGFRAGVNSNATFHSYRDPSPLNSVEVYKNTAAFIKEFVESEESVEKYIISSIAATEGLLSTEKQGAAADVNFLTGYTYEDKYKTREQMLTLKKEELLDLCTMFEKMKEKASVCVVGNADALKSLDESWKEYQL